MTPRTPASLPPAFRLAVGLQVAYGVLVALWQVVGLWRLSAGEQALGPTASGNVAIFAVASTGALYALARAFPGFYVGLASLLALPALATIQNAFVSDPSLWPGSSARWGGVALNTLGVLAPTLAFIGWRQLRERRPR